MKEWNGKHVIFQSTPSSQKVTKKCLECGCEEVISIHTFLAEGDMRRLLKNMNVTVISIHTFLAEGDME